MTSTMTSKLPEAREERWSLKGKKALVTGGTKGIGYAIVEELAGFGAIVHTCSRNQNELNERLKEWEDKGFKVSGSVCDLTSRAERENLMNTVFSQFNGKLDILVSNAGTSLQSRVENYTSEELSYLIGLNLEAPFHLAQLSFPSLKASEKGNIIFVSSVAGMRGLPGVSVYSATKAAINQLTRSLACEWAKHNIRVNAVAPWTVNTSFIQNMMVPEKSITEVLSREVLLTPLYPIAEADEISPLVAFLCLPVACYITGQVICVDGGYVAGAAMADGKLDNCKFEWKQCVL